MHDITFVITSFERKSLLFNCVGSVRKYYPGISIIVVDDSRGLNVTKELYDNMNIRCIRMPFDSGASAKRNIGLCCKVENNVGLLF